MNGLKTNLSILILLLCWSSCTTSNIDDDFNQVNNDLNFHFGGFGSLCGFSDSLSVFNNLDTHYDVMEIELCGDLDFETSMSVSQDEYNRLINSFSLADFQALKLNSCSRCVDGIDRFLFIEGSEFKHRIVFDGSSDISTIQDLVSELEVIREAHQPE